MIKRFPNRIVHNSLLILYARDRLHALLNYTIHEQGPYCARLTSSLFGKAVGVLYAKQFPSSFVEMLEKKTDDLFGRLKNSLAIRMKAALWLDPDSRTAALNKLEKMKGKFITKMVLGENGTNPLDNVSDFFLIFRFIY